LDENNLLKGGEFLIADVESGDVFTPEDFTDEHKQIAETTEQFVKGELIPQIDKLEEMDTDLVKEYMAKAGELGLLMIDASEEDGGLELDKVTSLIVAERMTPAGSFNVVYAAHNGIGTLPLIYYGTKEQKAKYLGKIISGEWIASYALTEPDSGSDALAAKTSAVLSDDGGHYLLTGTKQFITNAGFASLYTVFAKVDKEHFTGFLVERDFEGVSLGPEEKKMGIKGSSTRQVILENAKVPVGNVLGEVGKGHKIAFNILNMGRLKLGASTTGGSKASFMEGVQYANIRKQFGKTIGSFGAIKEKIADMAADIYASESVIYRLAGMLDARIANLEKGIDGYYVQYQKCVEEYAAECAIAKVFCTETLAECVDMVVQIHGGYGFVGGYAAERHYRDERINRIWEGTNEINRMLIPGMILRRSMKGELPLQKEAMKAFDALMTPSLEGTGDDTLFAKEKALLKGLKTVFLVLAGAASQKYQMKLVDEQEILMASADIAIQLFACESVILRAEKTCANANDNRKKLIESVVKVFTFRSVENLATAARKGAFYVERGDTLKMILSGIRRFTKYDAEGLLDAKRELADAALENEKYIF